MIEVLGTRGSGPPGVAFSYQALQDLRRGTRVCSSIIGFSNITFHALIDGRAMQRLSGQFVTGDYFSALGVSGVRGRPITPEDDRIGGNAVAVISDAMWQDDSAVVPTRSERRWFGRTCHSRSLMSPQQAFTVWRLEEKTIFGYGSRASV